MKSLVFYLICFAYLVIILNNIIHIISVKKWISENQNINHESYSRKRLYLFIPVLNEQNIICQTYNHFRTIANQYNNIHVVFIPTNKEKKCGETPTTCEMIEKLMEAEPCENIHLINYSYSKGVMAHQLNYAIRTVRNNIESESDFWIGVYNADSRITDDTIHYLNSVVLQADGSKKCFQQYSWYLNPSTKRKSLLSSASL